ncbi:unnamed protein product [Blepharisma stoltei]|uniref:Uncharacterized protein n=1 Tax=Blepharisma stoltei TaxID=1481888 RepID=A0AAU9J781_9CILI|nr:unnamed protein product [Blepharisma stoltei]
MSYSKTGKKTQRPQPIRNRAAPPLEQFQLNDNYDLQRWNVINMQYNSLFREKPENPNKSNQSPNSSFSKSLDRSAKRFDNLPKPTSEELKARYYHIPQLVVENGEFNDLPKPKFILEEAERKVAKRTEGIDQNSLPYEVYLRRMVQEIHLIKLEDKENQWKNELAQAEEALRRVKERKDELESLVKNRQAHKLIESEGSKEISKLLELKAKVQNDIEKIDEAKGILNSEVDNLHKELEELSDQFSHREAHLSDQIEAISKRLTMSDNERIENMAKEKTLLLSKQNELILRKQEVYEKWEQENKQLVAIYEQTEDKKAVITQELQELQMQKDKLEAEREEFERENAKFEEEMQIITNNQHTLILHNKFQEKAKSPELAQKITETVQKAAGMILEIMKENNYISPSQISSALYTEDDRNETAISSKQGILKDILLQLKLKQDSRMEEIDKNSSEQASVLNSRIEEEKTRRSRSPSPISRTPKTPINEGKTTASLRLNNLSQRINNSMSKSLNSTFNMKSNRSMINLDL